MPDHDTSQPSTLPASFYITTAIDYVNAPPHIGHAYEKIACDAVARYYRLRGVPTYFLTGTDEHGQKIQQNAESQGLTPQAFVDTMADHFKATWALCNISYDQFVRTTQSDHYQLVNALWQKLVANGAIYKAAYKAHYCKGCEAFLNERDLDAQGLCLLHKVAPQAVEEENYFFRLTAYKERLLTLFDEHPDFIVPAFRMADARHMLDNLQDISVSRPRSSVAWGIPVPDDDEQVIYVWIDALSNYLTGLGYRVDEPAENQSLFNQFWLTSEGKANAVHVIGKDIVRFHALYWPAMLMAADIAVPKQIIAHGFINLNNEKISKSLGNVIAPQDILEHFKLPNADALRYYLLVQAPFGADGTISIDDFKLRVNADLANNMGNLLNRTLSMLAKYYEGCVPAWPAAPDAALSDLLLLSTDERHAMERAYQGFAFHTLAERALSRVDAANKLINEREPWTLFKNERHDELSALMRALLEVLAQTAIVLSPIMPVLCQHVWSQLGLSSQRWDGLNWDALEQCLLVTGEATSPTGPLLPRLDSELADASQKKKVK